MRRSNYKKQGKIRYKELTHYIVNIVKVGQEHIESFLKLIRTVSTPISRLRWKNDLFSIILDNIKFEGIRKLYLKSSIHKDTLNRIIFLRVMLITFDENLFLDEYKTKQRNVNSTTQNVKVTSIESIQNFERCNENNCNDVDLRQYIQDIMMEWIYLLVYGRYPELSRLKIRLLCFKLYYITHCK